MARPGGRRGPPRGRGRPAPGNGSPPLSESPNSRGRTTEEFAGILADSVPTGLLLLSSEGRIVFANRSLRDSFGLGDGSLADCRLEGVLPFPEVRQALAGSLDEAGEPRTFIAHHPNSAVRRILRVTLTRAPGDGGKGHVLVLVDDLTEEMRLVATARRASDRLEREHAFLEAVLDNMTDGVAACGADGALVFFNAVARRIHGMPPIQEEPPAWPEGLRLTEADGRASIDLANHPLLDALRQESVRDREIQVDPGGGEPRRLLCNGRSMGPEGGPTFGAVLVMKDITERRKAEAARAGLEAQLRQAQKLEAIGTLAGGVAHDFNNVLTAVMGYSDFLLDTMEEGAPHRTEIQQILRAAQRGANLTRQLLAFSRGQVLEPQVTDLNAAVEGLEGMLRRLIGEHIELVTDGAEGLWPVFADPGQIEQALVNLVVNARDAMPEGGRISVWTSNEVLNESFCALHPGSRPGRFVRLSVADTGAGMDRETLSRIFEPFFTTKGKGKGTGLGLATVYGIAKQSGGSVYADSEPGRGTTFRLYFPRHEEPAGPPKGAAGEGAPAAAPRPPRGRAEARGRVLLVEDEEVVRDMVSSVLRRNGFEVSSAPHGEEALRVADREGAVFDLLLTDLVMPRMNGRDLARRLCARDPAMKVLLMSGYTDRPFTAEEVNAPGVSFLHKPFTPSRLMEVVTALLDRE